MSIIVVSEELDYVGSVVAESLGALCSEEWACELPPWELGDCRTCPRHPGVKTSSPDGLHDTPCGYCESEMDFEE